ncbi:MAG TPA: PTS glucose transporter subunit IIA [Candidatus Caccovicinus merdipullorum]|uniref:PTS glucose transporter subunit IIA n=1 Tax=Candidatus Caccovicinus merdipullorum TaxID=2840724 RepID=A0A9D1GHA8_9FIRM|nr:PTS glucose transporter subunit IIA [Candidatus Caccovicinus merdipullorum]
MLGGLKKLFGGTGGDFIYAPAAGKAIPMSQVNDPTFSQEILGKGVAIEPSEGRITAPADGKITMVFDTKHAISMTTLSGAELIIHVGLDTVQLKGKYFTAHVQAGDKVQAGDLLLEFDLEEIRKAGYQVTTPVIVCNTPSFPNMKCLSGMEVKAQDKIIELK